MVCGDSEQEQLLEAALPCTGTTIANVITSLISLLFFFLQGGLQCPYHGQDYANCCTNTGHKILPPIVNLRADQFKNSSLYTAGDYQCQSPFPLLLLLSLPRRAATLSAAPSVCYVCIAFGCLPRPASLYHRLAGHFRK